MKIDDVTPELLRETRKRARLSQTEFGRICGVSKTAVLNWERDQGDPLHTKIGGAAAQVVLMIHDDLRNTETFLERAGAR